MSRHQGSIVLWHMEGPRTPCFPHAVPRGFSRDVSPNWPSRYFTLLSLVRIRPHAPARNIFIRISSPFTFPLLRRTIGYDCGFACILTRDLYALRSYWNGLSDEIPVYFFNIVTNKAGIPCIQWNKFLFIPQKQKLQDCITLSFLQEHFGGNDAGGCL